MAPRTRETAVFILICALMAGVFVFDIYTPPDDVSVCFIYAVLVSLSAFSFRRAAYFCAALATLLSWAGAFFQTPSETLHVVFFTNRAIAVATQWLVAFFVVQRKDAEAKIQQQYDAEKKKAETSRRFVDVLTHEIGTSLTMIEGQAFRLKRLMASGTPEDAPSRADKIRGAVRHIERVLRQVQIATEIEQGQIAFEPAAVNLRDMIVDVTAQLAGERTINLDINALPETMSGNPEMLQQIVENLLSNAIKYSQPDTAVSIWGRTDNGAAVVSITDRGRGIPKGEKEKLFDPYYRASNSRNIQGAGIGLYVVHRYVISHKGSIDIASELGAGTAVTFRIPIVVPEASQPS